MPTNPLGKFQ